METYISIAMIIISIAMVISIVLQSKGAGLGGLTGVDTGGVFTARRGIEKTLFWVTLVLSIVFFVLAISAVILAANT
jgi:preprotein translocase subunit SecG